MKYTMGERLNIRFNRKIKLEFHGARLTSDGGLLACRELEDALGLFESVSTVMSDKRTGRNIQRKIKHWSLRTLLVKLIKTVAKVRRQSRYVTFQMAEVAIRKAVFAEILLRINRLLCYSMQ